MGVGLSENLSVDYDHGVCRYQQLAVCQWPVKAVGFTTGEERRDLFGGNAIRAYLFEIVFGVYREVYLGTSEQFASSGGAARQDYLMI